LVLLFLWIAACSTEEGTDGVGDPAAADAGTGGSSGTGGAHATGGAAGNGGATGNAGAAGKGSGGSSSTGGSSGTGGAAGTGGANSGGVADGGPTTSPFDWVGIVGTGQSLSQGWESTAISTTQPFGNLKLQDDGPDPKYPIAVSATAKWSTVALTEPIRTAVPGTGPGYGDNQYPDNIYHAGSTYGETPHSGMANTISLLCKARGAGDCVTAHTVVGFGGAGVKDISKGARGYLAAINEAGVYKGLAATAGKTYGAGGIILTHGEADSSNPTYGASVYQLWKDYNADLKAVTGQTEDVVLLASQQSSSAPGYDGSQVQIWRAGVDHPGQIICTGPKYQYGPYGLHMPGPAYEALGEKYGEVFDLVVNQKKGWKPLGPNKVARSGAVITIDFDVPNPPLAWDTHLAPPHEQMHTGWANGRGFEVIDGSGGEVAIVSVEIQGASVLLTLSQAPAAGTTLTLGYALTQDTAQAYQGGTDLGPHGLLRDSDAVVGYDAETIDVQVTSGSANLGGPQDAFTRRGARDVVTGTGVPADTVLKSALPWGLTMSAPWPGATGTASLSFRHDLANYCVHFAMAIP
jgi:hypothetical protein